MSEGSGVPSRQSELNLYGSSPQEDVELAVTIDFVQAEIRFVWSRVEDRSVIGRGSTLWEPELITAQGYVLGWSLEDLRPPGRTDRGLFKSQSTSVRALVSRVERWIPTKADRPWVRQIRFPPGHPKLELREAPTLAVRRRWLEAELYMLAASADAVRDAGVKDVSHWRKWAAEEWLEDSTGDVLDNVDTLQVPQPPAAVLEAAIAALRQQREREGRERVRIELAKSRANEFRRREEERRRRRAEAAAATSAKAERELGKPEAIEPSPAPPPIEIQLDPMPLVLQPGLLPLSDLRSWFLREEAMQWWVSNQTDDLLALPFCRIERLEYQIRTALRVIGPMRGRALLSDEVGLGKTIEAGLVLREYVTRGMVGRFLVLTMPSLVDQWAEELADKFGLETTTTNSAARSDPETFWRESKGIVASLHTLKQPSHLAIAREVSWDLLIIDEAHHLRRRESQAWQAVNALPRQFLLLLTATPVQNSLEELYNLVSLLQPGQLPSPKEFRSRFVDPKRPRQPREPEELRRMLQQIMIRNTRSNSGIRLPSRRARTVFFESGDAERAFWNSWETEFRACLETLSPSQSSLWGRLLLQAAGSSPDAWRSALDRFPDASAAARWRDGLVPGEGWNAKCALLPPLAKTEGGVVVFSQFLATQAALASYLKLQGVPAWVINGQTPAAERQPLVEEFRRQGGVLVLSRSGTEGRNLQFSSRLVNFDLPWNPMEIEQRIGRLHRLGQTRPVEIYNFVAKDTLQHHLLELLQEKLNLFELVVGETGLILGERFSSDEFAQEVLNHWRTSEDLAKAFAEFGDELAAARNGYEEIRKLDQTLFEHAYESD